MTSLLSHKAPVLRTERLQLVSFDPRHFEAFAALHADPDTMRHIGHGRPLDRVEAWLHLATLIGHWVLRGYGIWAVEDRTSGELVGRAGLLHPEGWSHPELNWMIASSHQGEGLATEAAQAVLAYARSALGLPVIVSLVRPANVASSRIARKLGATLHETIEFMGGPMDVFHYK